MASSISITFWFSWMRKIRVEMPRLRVELAEVRGRLLLHACTGGLSMVPFHSHLAIIIFLVTLCIVASQTLSIPCFERGKGDVENSLWDHINCHSSEVPSYN